MSATLLDGRGRTIRTVRNLGWLLRNSGHVELITIVPIRPVRGVDRGEVRMIVSLDALAPPPQRGTLLRLRMGERPYLLGLVAQ